MLQIYKALADKSRLRILRVLQRGRFNVNELVEILEMGQSRVSRHLKLLLDAQLLEVKREGTWAYYQAHVGADPGLVGEQLVYVERYADEIEGSEVDEARRLACLEARRQRSRDFHDRVATDWAALRSELFGHDGVTARLIDALGSPAVVADLGCGAGELLPHLATRAGRVIGIDSSPSMLEQARLAISEAPQGFDEERVELRLGALEHLPLADGEADAAVLSMVLHHLADPPAVLREVRRTLMPGGQVVVCDLASHEQEWMRDTFGDQWLGFSEDALRRIFSTAGLEIVELTHYKDLPRTGLQLVVARAPAQGDRP